MNTMAVINIARNQLGLDDDTYRDLLSRVTGKRSLREMSEGQRRAVVKEMQSCGFRMTPAKGRRRPAASKAYVRLVHALWRSCAGLGVIEDGSRPALRAFVSHELERRGLKPVSDPDFLTYDQAGPIIETLKAMERRGKASAETDAKAGGRA